MNQKMTPKMQRFVDEYIIDLNATQAAIRAGYSAKSAAQIADEILRKPQIRGAIEKRQGKIRERAEITLDDILRELDENRVAALSAKTPQAGAATAATVAKAKLLGLIVDKVEATGKNGTPLMQAGVLLLPATLNVMDWEKTALDVVTIDHK